MYVFMYVLYGPVSGIKLYYYIQYINE